VYLIPLFHSYLRVLIFATANIQNLDAFNGLSISRDANGNIDPAQDLFRTNWPGVTSGPIVSQFLLADFDIDGIVVEPKQKTFVPEVEYMTGVNTWLDVQERYKRFVFVSATVPWFRRAETLTNLNHHSFCTIFTLGACRFPLYGRCLGLQRHSGSTTT